MYKMDSVEPKEISNAPSPNTQTSNSKWLFIAVSIILLVKIYLIHSNIDLNLLKRLSFFLFGGALITLQSIYTERNKNIMLPDAA